MEQQQPSYGVEDLITVCTQTYTSIINTQILQILNLEAQVKELKDLIASSSTREHKLQKEIAELKE